jgi:hypothetical protein
MKAPARWTSALSFAACFCHRTRIRRTRFSQRLVRSTGQRREQTPRGAARARRLEQQVVVAVRARASAVQDYPTAVHQQAALRPSLTTVRWGWGRFFTHRFLAVVGAVPGDRLDRSHAHANVGRAGRASVGRSLSATPPWRAASRLSRNKFAGAM